MLHSNHKIKQPNWNATIRMKILLLLLLLLLLYKTDIKFRNGVILRSKVAPAHAMYERAALRNGGTLPLILDFGTKWI
jgi:hypothetical protein